MFPWIEQSSITDDGMIPMLYTWAFFYKVISLCLTVFQSEANMATPHGFAPLLYEIQMPGSILHAGRKYHFRNFLHPSKTVDMPAFCGSMTM